MSNIGLWSIGHSVEIELLELQQQQKNKGSKVCEI